MPSSKISWLQPEEGRKQLTRRGGSWGKKHSTQGISEGASPQAMMRGTKRRPTGSPLRSGLALLQVLAELSKRKLLLCFQRNQSKYM